MRPQTTLDEMFLSVVMVGRNDNYGGDFRERAQHCINGLVSLLRSVELPSEVIFVNYNPLPEPDIIAFLNWPSSTSHVSLRVLTVPGHVHRNVVEQGVCRDVPVLEYVAKNAGIRRARGRFILCMNPDITLPESFGRLVPHLREDCFYRADRLNYDRLENGKPQGFTTLMMKGHAQPVNGTGRINIATLRVGNELRCRWKRLTCQIEGLLNYLEWTVFYDTEEFRLHCNASGDFMLMHRNAWQTLRGYREQAEIALHVDSLMVVQAAALGLRQRLLSDPILHKEHGRRYDGSVETPENARAYDFLLKEARKMRDSQRSACYNDRDWGLSNFDLPLSEL
jgi:hypothetical protein